MCSALSRPYQMLYVSQSVFFVAKPLPVDSHAFQGLTEVSVLDIIEIH